MSYVVYLPTHPPPVPPSVVPPCAAPLLLHPLCLLSGAAPLPASSARRSSTLPLIRARRPSPLPRGPTPFVAAEAHRSTGGKAIAAALRTREELGAGREREGRGLGDGVEVLTVKPVELWRPGLGDRQSRPRQVLGEGAAGQAGGEGARRRRPDGAQDARQLEERREGGLVDRGPYV